MDWGEVNSFLEKQNYIRLLLMDLENLIDFNNFKIGKVEIHKAVTKKFGDKSEIQNFLKNDRKIEKLKIKKYKIIEKFINVNQEFLLEILQNNDFDYILDYNEEEISNKLINYNLIQNKRKVLNCILIYALFKKGFGNKSYIESLKLICKKNNFKLINKKCFPETFDNKESIEWIYEKYKIKISEDRFKTLKEILDLEYCFSHTDLHEKLNIYEFMYLDSVFELLEKDFPFSTNYSQIEYLNEIFKDSDKNIECYKNMEILEDVNSFEDLNKTFEFIDNKANELLKDAAHLLIIINTNHGLVYKIITHNDLDNQILKLFKNKELTRKKILNGIDINKYREDKKKYFKILNYNKNKIFKSFGIVEEKKENDFKYFFILLNDVPLSQKKFEPISFIEKNLIFFEIFSDENKEKILRKLNEENKDLNIFQKLESFKHLPFDNLVKVDRNILNKFFDYQLETNTLHDIFIEFEPLSTLTSTYLSSISLNNTISPEILNKILENYKKGISYLVEFKHQQKNLKMIDSHSKKGDSSIEQHMNMVDNEKIEDFLDRRDKFIKFRENKIIDKFLKNKDIKEYLFSKKDIIEKEYNGSIIDVVEFLGDKLLNHIFSNNYVKNIPNLSQEYKIYDKSIPEVVIQKLKNKNCYKPYKLFHKLKHCFSSNLIKFLEDGEYYNLSKNEKDKFLKICSEHDIKFNYKTIKLKIEDPKSVHYWYAGEASKCCMKIGSKKMLQYLIDKGYSLLNIYIDDKVRGNIVLSTLNGKKYLLMDNIEINPNFKKYESEIFENLLKFLNILKLKEGYENIFLGSRYNDIDSEIIKKEFQLIEKLGVFCISNLKNYMNINVENKKLEDYFSKDTKYIKLDTEFSTYYTDAPESLYSLVKNPCIEDLTINIKQDKEKYLNGLKILEKDDLRLIYEMEVNH